MQVQYCDSMSSLGAQTTTATEAIEAAAKSKPTINTIKSTVNVNQLSPRHNICTLSTGLVRQSEDVKSWKWLGSIVLLLLGTKTNTNKLQNVTVGGYVSGVSAWAVYINGRKAMLENVDTRHAEVCSQEHGDKLGNRFNVAAVNEWDYIVYRKLR